MPVVLCVDDDRTGLALRKLILETQGYVVLTATSGPGGLEIVRRMAVDAVVLDFQMPAMDGIQVAKILRAERPGLPIIMLSGSGEVPAAALSIVNEYLQKSAPELPRSLDQSLRRLTSRRFHNAA